MGVEAGIKEGVRSLGVDADREGFLRGAGFTQTDSDRGEALVNDVKVHGSPALDSERPRASSCWSGSGSW